LNGNGGAMKSDPMSNDEKPGREFYGGRSAMQQRPAADGEPPLNQKSRWDDLRPRFQTA